MDIDCDQCRGVIPVRDGFYFYGQVRLCRLCYDRTIKKANEEIKFREKAFFMKEMERIKKEMDEKYARSAGEANLLAEYEVAVEKWKDYFDVSKR